MNEGSEGGDREDADVWQPVDASDDADGDGGAPGEHEQWAERLEQKQQQLDERERELERREQEILERREENVEKREELDAREEDLEEFQAHLEEREADLERRSAELDEREEDVDTKREALEEYASSGRTFTKKPRVAGGILLWVTAVTAALLAAATFLYAGPGGLVEAGLLSQTATTAATAVLAVIALIELVGGYFAYRGQYWSVAVAAAILGIVVLFPVGVTAAVMITVGESQFD
jgi:hypothetical protein